MASTKKDTHITNLAALEKAANGEIVALPGWTEEQPFVARLKRASLTGMIRAGKIPNPLIAAAQKLYEGLNKSRANATFEETAKVYASCRRGSTRRADDGAAESGRT